MFLADQYSILTMLGWSLLNSIWQFAMLLLLYKTWIKLFPSASAAIKHTAALSMTMIGAAGFAVTFLGYSSHYFRLPDFSTGNISGIPALFSQNIIVFLSVAYLATILVLLTRFAVFIRRTGLVKKHGLHKINARYRLYVADLADRMHIRFPVKVWLSEHVDTAQIIGFFKPVILLPIALFNQLTPVQVEAILLHELAHIKRNDYVVNLFLAMIRILFFFNPFARYFTNAIRQEREFCCDEWVLQFQFDPHGYASALFTLEKGRTGFKTIGVGASGHHPQFLLQRVHRILNIPFRAVQENHSRKIVPVLLGLFSFGPFMLNGLIGKRAHTDSAHTAKVAAEKMAMVQPILFQVPDPPKPGPSLKATTSKSSPVCPGTTPSSNYPVGTSVNLLAKLAQLTETNAAMTEAVAQEDRRDFSIDEKKDLSIPADVDTRDAPFIPSVSFDYQPMHDSTQPPTRILSYNELRILETKAKLNYALARVNWEKIRKEVGNDQRLLNKIRAEISSTINNIDWKKLQDDEVRVSEKERTENMNLEISELTQSKLYLRQQEQLKLVQEKLIQQQDLYQQQIRENNRQLQELQHVQKTRKIVVI